MKLIFSSVLFILIANDLLARDIILVENLATKEEGQMLLKILEMKFKIPHSMLTFKDTQKCSLKTEAIMHLCLQQNGELDVLKVNRYVVNNSLSSFFEDDLAIIEQLEKKDQKNEGAKL